MAGRWIGVGLFLLAGALPALAAEAGQSFAKGSWALELSGSYIDAYYEDTAGGQGTVGVGYHLLDGLGLYAQFPGYYFQDSDGAEAEAVGGGFNLLARWHFLRFERCSLYLDGGAGLVQTSESIPSNGTHFNFTERVGLGVSYRLKDNLHLMGGARFFHLSNARIDGADQNPGLDAIEYYAGLVMTF